MKTKVSEEAQKEYDKIIARKNFRQNEQISLLIMIVLNAIKNSEQQY